MKMAPERSSQRWNAIQPLYFQERDLFFRCWLPQNDPIETRAILILIHGAGQHSGYYTDLAPICQQHQLIYVTPDLRGFGQSGGARGHVNRFNEYLEDLDYLIQRISSWVPDKPIFLAGHSLGGLVVIRYVQEYKSKIRGGIISAPALGLRFRLPYVCKKALELASWLRPALPVNTVSLAMRLRHLPWFQYLRPDPNKLKQDPHFTFHYTPRWLKELLQNGSLALVNAVRYSLPTLCIYFEEDPLIDAALIRQFYEAIATEKKLCIALPERSHNLWVHPERPKIIQNMLQWMTELAAEP